MPPSFNTIQIGPGGSYEAITPASAHTAFSNALAQLPPAGGELIVSPGYDRALASPVKYLFGALVHVSVPNVTIRFAPGAVLDFSGTSVSQMFLVSAPGFRVIGAVVEHQALHVDGRSCFRIQQPPAPNAHADGASFVGCRFRVRQAAVDVLGFSCIRSEGIDDKPRRGLQVRGCTFEILPGLPSLNAWQGDEPYGICAIRARDTEDCQLYENRFQGPPGSSRAHCGPMILLDGCERSVVASSVFDHLDLVPASRDDPPPAGGSLIRLTTHAGLAGHHSSISSNVFRSIDCRHVVELVDCRSDLVTVNHFGDIGPHCEAALRVRGSGGVALTVFGNVFQGVSALGSADLPGHMIQLGGIASATLEGNVLTGSDAGTRPLELDPASCANVHVGPTQVLRTRAP